MVDEECSRGDDMWLLNPYAPCPMLDVEFMFYRMPFEHYGETLVITRTDDKQAVKMLRRAMLGINSVNWPAKNVLELIRTRIFLSRALRNIGEDDEAKTQ